MGKYVRRRMWNFDGEREILLYSGFQVSMGFNGIGLLGRTNRACAQFLN